MKSHIVVDMPEVMNTYKLMFIKGIHQLDRKWKNYPKENWEDDIPKVENYGIIKDTRFKRKEHP